MEEIIAPSKEIPHHGLTIFLGGGITGCPEWQKVILKKLSFGNISIWNPRRPSFPMGDRKEGRIQIIWERDRLIAADINVYWFPKESICPITLLEFGGSCRARDLMVVGMDPEYERRFDVETYLDISDPLAAEHIAYDLDTFAQRIIKTIGDVETARRFGPRKQALRSVSPDERRAMLGQFSEPPPRG